MRDKPVSYVRVGGRGGGVAYFAHIGGFVAGMAIILLRGGRRLVKQRPPPPGDYYHWQGG